MNKGILIYETPEDKICHKVFAILIYIIYIIFIIGLFISGFTTISNFGIKTMMSVILPGSLFIAFSQVALHFLHCKFRIYENGVTTSVSELLSLFKEEGKLIPYSQIRAYTRHGKKRQCMTVYIQIKRFIVYNFYKDDRKGVIDVLEENLKKHKVPEMPENCPHCKSKLYTYTINCHSCKEKVIWS